MFKKEKLADPTGRIWYPDTVQSVSIAGGLYFVKMESGQPPACVLLNRL